jgi:secreted trypsin-like serine protease
MLTGIISWGIGCGTAGVPGVYGSVQKALCFIDYATKCKHGKKYTNFYDYKEDCSYWIDETIEDLSKKVSNSIAKGFFEEAKALKDSCEA